MSKNIILSILTTVVLFTAPYQSGLFRACADTSAQNTDQTLSKLEDRFFEHQYSTDPDADRISRLETFVFGCAQTGSMNDRLQHIMSTIPDDALAKVTNPTDPTSDTDTSNSDNSQPASTTSSEQTSDTSSSKDDDQQVGDAPAGRAFDYSSYPSVTSLEQELLGHTYTSDPLARRLARLETKAFGAPSTSNDLSQRTDNLENYQQRHDLYSDRTIAGTPATNMPAFTPVNPLSRRARNIDTRTDDPSDNDAAPRLPNQYISKTGSFVGSVEERVSMMEAQAFGHTYPDRPLDKRLAKLEKRLLPNQDDSQLGLFERTGKLWVALHPTDKTKVDQFLASNQLVDDRIVSIGSAGSDSTSANNNSDNSSSSAKANSNNNNSSPSTANTNKVPKRYSWLSKLGTSLGSPGPGEQGADSYTSQSPIYNPPGMYLYNYNGGPTPAGYTSRSFGATFGPGAGPAGSPVGFW